MDSRDQEKHEIERNGGQREDGVGPIPADVMKAVEEDIEAAGGEYEEAPEYEGAIGRTMFDTAYSEDGTVTVLMPKENIEDVPRQSLVRIKSIEDERSYLGAVVKGPFAEPDGLRADSPILVSVTVRGIVLQPKHHGRVQVEIVGEELNDGAVVPPRRRPLPNSPVFVLDSPETADVLGTGGNVYRDLWEQAWAKNPEYRDLVFPSRAGTPLDHGNVNRQQFKKLLKKAGLLPMRPYDIRHSFATLWIESGESAEVLQKVLGHSSIATTINTYSHLSPRYQREAFGRFGDALRGG